MERIAVYGIGGLYNYGCEAIVRGTVRFIRKQYPNSHITYYSKNYDYDKSQIVDLNITIKNIENEHTLLRRIIGKIINIFRIPIVPFVQNEFQQIINESDIIFSVGGDIYSIPKHLRSKSKYRYVNPMVEFGKLAKNNKKMVIIYGASIGPFGEYHNAKKYYIEHLKEVDRIYCREYNSIEYLNEIGLHENVKFLPDPAFLINENIKLETAMDYIGINLSELAFRELYGDISDEEIWRVCSTLRNISKELNLSLMLIPHVFSPITDCDNDYNFLKKIYNILKNDFKIKAILVRPIGFMDAKNYLCKCRFVICARMHCAVNAITIGVPAIFVSYSIKSKGMANFVYGDEHWVISLEKLNEDIVSLAIEMNTKLEDLKCCIQLKMKEVRDIYS